MILTENQELLHENHQTLLSELMNLDNQDSVSDVQVELAKSGVPTVKINLNGKTLYLQSKYDPEREAENLINKFIEEETRYVLFVGVGMGYHITRFMKIHPYTQISIYEPNENVLNAYLSTIKLSKVMVRNIKSIFIGTNKESIETNIQDLLKESHQSLKIITLPVYEKLYEEEITTIFERTKVFLLDKYSEIATNVSFQKRWTINSIKNFPTVLQTPNILHDIDENAFKDKPVIIVAAGPSLNVEFENLRYIKEHGLAYIFSVGSAINAMIEKGIHPDAACTYDPQAHNFQVIQRIKNNNIKDIPLIFGSSVGYETILNYPGKLLHMLVNQDTVSYSLLKRVDAKKVNFVYDAPSIAVMTFQMLAELNVSDIILVGQNFGYIGNQNYAQGISYGTGSEIVSKESMKEAIIVKDVYGNDIKTTDGYNRMRNGLEIYISDYPRVKVWNTTKGGAAILGAEFLELEKLVRNVLKNSVCEEHWLEGNNQYDHHFIKSQIVELDKKNLEFEAALNKAIIIIRSIEELVNSGKYYSLENYYPKLDKEIVVIKENISYQTFIEPMIRVQQEQLSINVKNLKYEVDEKRKADVIVKEFTEFLKLCEMDYQVVHKLYTEMKNEIQYVLNGE